MFEGFNEMGSGPYEVGVRTAGSETKIGYAWFENGEGTQDVYFVLESGTKFPLPYGPDIIFSPQAMPTVSEPNGFFSWVEQNGNLGADPECWAVEETYQTWQP